MIILEIIFLLVLYSYASVIAIITICSWLLVPVVLGVFISQFRYDCSCYPVLFLLLLFIMIH